MIDFGFGVCLGTLDDEWLHKIRGWRNDPRIFRWCRQDDLISKASHNKWFMDQGLDSTIRMYGVYEDGHNSWNLVGVAGLTSIDRIARKAEFSLYIDPDLHQKGLGFRALKTLLSHGFYNLGLNVVWGECLDGNPAIKRFEALGMVKEGTRRDFYFKDGRLWDAHLVSMTFDMWKVMAWNTLLS